MTIPAAAEPHGKGMPPTALQRRAAVLGLPATHSLSPVIHRRGFALAGLTDWRYGIAELAPADLPGFVESRGPAWRGFSVTMPLKETAATLGDRDRRVARTGVANTIVIDRDRAGAVAGRRVYNTDIGGFQRALAAAGLSAPRTAVVIGAGATALSAMVALGELGCAVTVTARRPDRAAALAELGAGLGFTTGVAGWGTFGAADLVVSTVPTGGVAALIAPLMESGPAAVFDVVYHPWPTPFATAAAARGCIVVNGLDLLVHQATEQFTLFTGRSVPAEPLLLAVREAAAQRARA
jgi:shikimate dehydrogenase